jgi:hypothetical protein
MFLKRQNFHYNRDELCQNYFCHTYHFTKQFSSNSLVLYVSEPSKCSCKGRICKALNRPGTSFRYRRTAAAIAPHSDDEKVFVGVTDQERNKDVRLYSCSECFQATNRRIE